MEVELTAPRRNRESTGPTPHSISIRAKPTLKKPREYLILERRRQEELREEANAMVTYNKQFDLKTTWERETAKKIQRNTVQRRMNVLLHQEQLSLNERREKLHDMLRAEEEQYMQEIAQRVETPLERQAKMRERAKKLKEKRESERLQFVQEKLDQRWRDQCEELRSILTKRHQDVVCEEREEQRRVKEEQKYRQQKEEEMFAKLWEEDIRAKARREEMEATLQIERNREQLKALNLQQAAKANEVENRCLLKQQEADLLKEQAALAAIEEQREREEKRRQQEASKAALDYSLKLKLRRKAREVQEELALDMKILQGLMQETNTEAQELAIKKKELQREINLYREQLVKQRKEEERREKEVDNLIQAEVEKIWAKRIAQWKTEKEARKKLMADVLATRKRQIEEKLAEIALQKEEEERERQAILHNFEEHKKLEKQQKGEQVQRKVSQQRDLLMQMEYQKRKSLEEKEQSFRELEMSKACEEMYQSKLKEHLGDAHATKLHPKRRSLLHTM